MPEAGLQIQSIASILKKNLNEILAKTVKHYSVIKALRMFTSLSICNYYNSQLGAQPRRTYTNLVRPRARFVVFNASTFLTSRPSYQEGLGFTN